MSKQFEELAKDLASGMSRRKAFWRFGAGIGAVVGGLITGKPARADLGPGSTCTGEACVDFCRGLGLEGRDFGQCVAACQRGLLLKTTCHTD